MICGELLVEFSNMLHVVSLGIGAASTAVVVDIIAGVGNTAGAFAFG